MKEKRLFTNASRSVCWDPVKCQHEGLCIKNILPESNATEPEQLTLKEPVFEALMMQTVICPSGALKPVE